MSAEGAPHALRGQLDQPYINDGDPGPFGGGTYTNSGIEPTIEDYENVFGPAARDIKFDTQRAKRHQRWHLPDVLKGPNPFLTDRIDGLITDATNSPFTTVILPYQFVPNPDAKLKWNVWSFDEGMASRVPYESAARVLTQTKKSFAGYVVRQGLAITMEHNFMKSPAGMENFRNQLKQLVGSIQYTNDLDVHMALIQAPSYARTIAEKYFNTQKTALQLCREYIDLFGIIQKTPNALDLLIEEAKGTLRNWGSSPPSFLLTNGKLTMQLQMSPERTSYVTQGYDGMKRLRTGPDIDSYRGLNIIKSRCFSTEAGMAPRDPLCRRVRVAEYYRIIPDDKTEAWMLYDQSKDTWFEITLEDLWKYSSLSEHEGGDPAPPPDDGAASLDGGSYGMRGSGGKNGKPRFYGHGTTGTRNPSFTVKKWLDQSPSAQMFKEACRSTFIIGDEEFITDVPQQYIRLLETIQNYDNVQASFDKDVVPFTGLIGGGIFNDITAAHIDEGSSDAFRIDQWCGLDLSDRMQTEIDKLQNGDVNGTWNMRHPNNFEFQWKGAHNASKIMSTSSILQAAFANVFISQTMLRYFLEPVTSLSSEELELGARLFTHNRAVALDQIFAKTRIFDLLLRYTFPDGKLRRAVTVSDDAFFQVCLAYLTKYMQLSATTKHGCSQLFSNEFQSRIDTSSVSVVTEWENKFELSDTSPDNTPYATYTEQLKTKLDNPAMTFTIMQAAVVIFAKRLFGCTNRFTHAQDPTNAKYGIALVCKHLPMPLAASHGAPRRLGMYTNSANRVSWLGVDEGKSGEASLSGYDDDGDAGDGDSMHDYEYVIIRPNIEHEMLGVIMGRGGSGELGATLWGQTELSCYDDSQHGVWGMSYKYHERAQVFNEKNMIRLWDVAFNGYNGGMDDSVAMWNNLDNFRAQTNDLSTPYQGPSMIVMRYRKGGPRWQRNWPSPIVFFDNLDQEDDAVTADPECIHNVVDNNMRVFKTNADYHDRYKMYKARLPDFGAHHKLRKPAGHASAQDETSSLSKLAFQGSLKARLRQSGQIIDVQTGCGHLGPSYVGVASVREGKGYKQQGAPTLGRLV